MIIKPLAVYTASWDGDTIENLPRSGVLPYKGVRVRINATVEVDTASVVFTIQGYDPAAEEWYTILESAAITAIGDTILRVYPGLTAAGNLVASDVLPAFWRVIAVAADADALTYSVNADPLY